MIKPLTSLRFLFALYGVRAAHLQFFYYAQYPTFKEIQY